MEIQMEMGKWSVDFAKFISIRAGFWFEIPQIWCRNPTNLPPKTHEFHSISTNSETKIRYNLTRLEFVSIF